MLLGKLTLNGNDYNRTPVALTNYSSVAKLQYEEFHTRMLIHGPDGRPFWSPPCRVILDSDGVAVCHAMEFKALTFLQVMNVVVADYDRQEMAKALDFMPFEISRGSSYSLKYRFQVKGIH